MPLQEAHGTLLPAPILAELLSDTKVEADKQTVAAAAAHRKQAAARDAATTGVSQQPARQPDRIGGGRLDAYMDFQGRPLPGAITKTAADRDAAGAEPLRARAVKLVWLQTSSWVRTLHAVAQVSKKMANVRAPSLSLMSQAGFAC